MKIPKKVISYVRANVGERYAVSFVGEKEGVCCFSAAIPDSETGFPIAIILNDKGEILKYRGFESLKVISEFLR